MHIQVKGLILDGVSTTCYIVVVDIPFLGVSVDGEGELVRILVIVQVHIGEDSVLSYFQSVVGNGSVNNICRWNLHITT